VRSMVSSVGASTGQPSSSGVSTALLRGPGGDTRVRVIPLLYASQKLSAAT
jgi:hypothetical protein